MWWNPFQTLSDKLDNLRFDVITGLSLILAKVEQMANATDAAITKLQGDVAGLATVVTSATALINGFKAQLDAAVAAAQAAGVSSAELQSLSDLSTAIGTQSAGLAAAVSANTPVPPTP